MNAEQSAATTVYSFLDYLVLVDPAAERRP
jgi:hypothetical protein